MCALCNPELSEETLRSYITKSEEKLGLVLKDKQCEAVCHFCHGNDVFVSLPTGYGKSIIYAILPSVFDDMTGLLLFIYGSYAYVFML